MKSTAKKEVNLYLLKGYESSLAASAVAAPSTDALGDFLANAPGMPWGLGKAGARVNAHAGKLQLPANLAAYAKCVRVYGRRPASPLLLRSPTARTASSASPSAARRRRRGAGRA